MQIRAASPTDAPRLMRIARLALGAHPAYAFEAKLVLLRQFLEPALREKIVVDPGYYIVAEVDEVPIGFTTLALHGGVARSDWTMADPAAGAPRVGARLFLHAIEEARRRGAHKLWGESLVDNPVVARFVLRHGGRIVARVERYWFEQDYDLWEIPLR